MLMADLVRDYAAGVLGRTDIEARYRELELRARQEFPGAKLQRLADYRMAFVAFDVCDKAHAARIVLVAGIIKTLWPGVCHRFTRPVVGRSGDSRAKR